MKESIGAVFLFQIAIAFLLLFTGIMSLTINHSKAFGVKGSIITSIEYNEGIDLRNATLPTDLIDAMTEESYRTTGKCPEDEDDVVYFGFDREGRKNSYEPSICIAKITFSNDLNMPSGSYIPSEIQKGCYFKAIVFYKLDFPVLKEVFKFSLYGETRVMYSPYC